MLLVLAPLPRLDRVQFVERSGGGVNLIDRVATDEAFLEHNVGAAHFEVGAGGLVAMRAAQSLGIGARALALRGGRTGDLIAEAAAEERIDIEWVGMAAPTPMRSVLCYDVEGAGMRRVVFSEVAPRLSDSELGAYVERAEAALADRASELVDAVVFIEVEASQGALSMALGEIARRARSRGRTCILVTRGESPGLAEGDFDIVLEDRSSATALRPRRVGDRATMLIRDEAKRYFLSLPADPVTARVELELELEPPKDRGGEAPLEAAAVAWQLCVREAWSPRSAACFAVAAAVAQTQKRIGGRLARSDVDGFYRQVRAREQD